MLRVTSVKKLKVRFTKTTIQDRGSHSQYYIVHGPGRRPARLIYYRIVSIASSVCCKRSPAKSGMTVDTGVKMKNARVCIVPHDFLLCSLEKQSMSLRIENKSFMYKSTLSMTI
jgi:hypothetical protein